jgi:DNA-binding transcriptional ArsR family regulator
MQLLRSLDATLAALSDPTRRAILARLAEGEATVSELAEPFTISQPAISRHIKVLSEAGLIVQLRETEDKKKVDLFMKSSSRNGTPTVK